MTEDDAGRAIRRVLAPLCVPLLVPSPSPADPARGRHTRRLEGLIEDVPRQRARARASRLVLAVAAAAAATLGLALAVSPGSRAHGASVPQASGSRGATLMAGRLLTGAGRSLAGGERITEPELLAAPLDQSALVLTEAGIQLTFAPGARASVPLGGEPLQRMRLAQGQVALDVPPLPIGAHFRIETLDATVVVHGTRFSVAYDSTAERTCVRVTEGRVEVTRAGGPPQLLTPGRSSGCLEATELPDEGPGAVAAAAPDRGPLSTEVAGETGSRPERGTGARPPPPSTLAAQNRLLLAALAAERSGDYAAAEGSLNALLARHPGSPFAPEARVALDRLERRRRGP